MTNKLVAAVTGAAVVAGTGAEAPQAVRTSGSLERSVVPTGRIKMDLSAGVYSISGAPGDKIRLEWKVQRAEQLSGVKARAEVRGADATISTESPSNSHFKVVIQVPQQADLYVRLTAGDLRVESIR